MTKGKVSCTNVLCKCGGMGMLQEWLELQDDGSYKRCAMVFCQVCNRKTLIKSARTYREANYEALLAWKQMNKPHDNEQ